MGSYFPEAPPVPGPLRPQHRNLPQRPPSCCLRLAVGGGTTKATTCPAPNSVPKTCAANEIVLLCRTAIFKGTGNRGFVFLFVFVLEIYLGPYSY